MNTNILRKNAFFAKYTYDDINSYIRSSKFHNELKEGNIVPVHKKKSKLSKENYRPISILPNISKVYEGLYVFIMSRTRFRVNPHSIVA